MQISSRSLSPFLSPAHPSLSDKGARKCALCRYADLALRSASSLNVGIMEKVTPTDTKNSTIADRSRRNIFGGKRSEESSGLFPVSVRTRRLFQITTSKCDALVGRPRLVFTQHHKRHNTRSTSSAKRLHVTRTLNPCLLGPSATRPSKVGYCRLLSSPRGLFCCIKAAAAAARLLGLCVVRDVQQNRLFSNCWNILPSTHTPRTMRTAVAFSAHSSVWSISNFQRMFILNLVFGSSLSLTERIPYLLVGCGTASRFSVESGWLLMYGQRTPKTQRLGGLSNQRSGIFAVVVLYCCTAFNFLTPG